MKTIYISLALLLTVGCDSVESEEATLNENTEVLCSDGKDNDGDGAIDCEDAESVRLCENETDFDNNWSCEVLSEGEVFTNPLNSSGPDPDIVYFGCNYYMVTTTFDSTLTIRKAPTIEALKAADPVVVHTDPPERGNHWAPEIHLLDGPNGKRWYYYYTGGNGGDRQRLHVLESKGIGPMGPYVYKGEIVDPVNEEWRIDSSVVVIDGTLYLLFSGFDGGYNNWPQNNYIAEMTNPWTVKSGSRTLLSTPTYAWEKKEGTVNEAPVALQRKGRTFIAYSASGCWGPNYAIGLLELTGDDPMSTDAWTKYPEPVFERSDENSVYGPAHNNFFKSPDGTEDWIVYHANDSVSGGCDAYRTPRIQKINWNVDGTPDFGTPVSTSTELAVPSGELSRYRP